MTACASYRSVVCFPCCSLLSGRCGCLQGPLNQPLSALQVMRRYHIQNRDDYKKYNKVVGMVTKLTNMLKQLDPQDKTRIDLTELLINK